MKSIFVSAIVQGPWDMDDLHGFADTLINKDHQHIPISHLKTCD